MDPAVVFVCENLIPLLKGPVLEYVYCTLLNCSPKRHAGAANENSKLVGEDR